MIDPNAIATNALAAFQMGRQEREHQDARRAFGDYASNPSEQGLNALAQFDPRFVMAERERQTQQQQSQQQQAREQQQIVARLINSVTDEATYQQALSAAQRLGLDTNGAPPNFDPQWVGEMKFLATAMQDRRDDLPGIADELVAAGFNPGTPEFIEAMRGVINNKYASEYVDEGGNIRRRSALALPSVQQGPQPGAIEDGYRFKGGNPADPNSWEQVMTDQQGGAALSAAHQARTITPDEAARIRQSLGPNGQAAFEKWVRDNNIVVRAR